MMICFCTAIGLGTLMYVSFASRYLGIFLAGLMFCTSEMLREKVWPKYVHQIQVWLVRIFFAATIAFEIPIKSFWNGRVWLKALTLVVPLCAKSVTGFLAPQPIKEEFWKASLQRSRVILSFFR